MDIYKCKKCNNELYEGECSASYLPPDEGVDCLVCDYCEETYFFTDEDDIIIERV